MPVVETFTTSIQAMHAATYLNERGVPASVVNEVSAYGGVMGMGVHVGDADMEGARTLLRGFWAKWQAEAASRTTGVEPVPDLTLLPREFAPGCPKCEAKLPLDALLRLCPACGTAVDVAELVVAERGPEALVACYEKLPIQGEPDAEAKFVCAKCQYDLRGLAVSGPCPECGTMYDKRVMMGEGSGH
ncbi:MAG: hypothetical protein AABZ53_01280 [Planctomycetota bacterium]